LGNELDVPEHLTPQPTIETPWPPHFVGEDGLQCVQFRQHRETADYGGQCILV
jgi:hypothetical protein